MNIAKFPKNKLMKHIPYMIRFHIILPPFIWAYQYFVANVLTMYSLFNLV